MNKERKEKMPIVLYNSTAKGKFMKYTSVGGITKSVWVDAYKEYLVPEVSSSSALVNKLDRSRIETAERLSNSKTLSAYILREKLDYLKDVTREPRWQKRISTRFTDKIGVIMTRGEKRYAFSVSSLSDLETLGSTVYSAGSLPVQLRSNYNGTYVYNSNQIEIIDGVIESINGFTGSDSYNLRNLIGTTSATVYIEEGASIFGTGVQYYQDANLSIASVLNETMKYDVPANNTNKKITLSSGQVSSSENYSMESKTYYLSGASGTSYTLYNEVGADVYNDSEGNYLFTDNQGVVGLVANRTMFTLVPSYKFITIVSGLITQSGDIIEVASFDTYVFSQGRTYTTVYVNSGAQLEFGTFVYIDSDLSTPLANGDYIYGGNTYTIGGSRILSVS